MMTPRLRRAGIADAEAVRDVTLAAYARWVEVIGRKPVPMLADYSVAVVAHQIDVLDLDGRIIGLIELVREDDCILIENIAVHPDHAGEGHGQRLLAHAENAARDHGFRLLRLYTNRLMVSNIAYYQRLGFLISHEDTTPDGRTIMYMNKQIKRPGAPFI